MAGPGGVWRYPVERLYDEVATIAFHFHWPHEQLMTLEHAERRRWVRHIDALVERQRDTR